MASRIQTPSASRRAFLAIGLGLGSSTLTLAAGCTLSDPRINEGHRSSTPRSTPTPSSALPGSLDGTDVEIGLASLARAILAKAPDELSSILRTVLEQLLDGHDDHARALLSPEPTTRPQPDPTSSVNPTPSTGSTPSLEKLSVKKAVKFLITKEQAAASSHLTSALATTGFNCLMWAAMSAAASQYAEALRLESPPATPGPEATRRPLTPVSDVEATQALLRQTHALIYGYQVAVAHLAGSNQDRAANRLNASRTFRNDLTELLVRRNAQVPVADSAYELPVEPRDSASSAQLIVRMETALQPFDGRWVTSAADFSSRILAITQLTATTLSAQSWGATLSPWPGWQD